MNNEENKTEEQEIAKKIEPTKKEKSSKSLVVIIIILIIAILGLVGYIAYDKLAQKEDKQTEEKDKEKTTKEEEKEKKEENRELTQVEKEKFENIIKNINPYFSQYFPVNSPKNVINNDELLLFALIKLGFDKQTFTGNDVEKIIKDNFGNSVSVTNKDIMCSIDNNPFYTYDATSNTYTKATNYNHGHDGPGFMETNNYFESSNIKDEKIVTINAKIMYLGYRSSTWGPTYEVFKTYDDAKKGTNAVYKDEKEEPIDFNDGFYQSIKDKLPTTTYTFEKNSEGYFDLVSVTIK